MSGLLVGGRARPNPSRRDMPQPVAREFLAGDRAGEVGDAFRVVDAIGLAVGEGQRGVAALEEVGVMRRPPGSG